MYYGETFRYSPLDRHECELREGSSTNRTQSGQPLPIEAVVGRFRRYRLLATFATGTRHRDPTAIRQGFSETHFA